MTREAGRLVRLSELEGVALGIVSRDSPCTPYAVRQSLKASPSSHWRGSAGSIYPMLERLEERGHLKSDMDRSDGRGRRLLRITKLGQKALGLWIQQGADPQTVAAISDHVRTRVFFMSSLPPEERREFLTAMAEALEGYLRVTEEWLEQTDRDQDPFAWFASQNAVFQARARVEWLAGFQGAMDELAKNPPSIPPVHP